MLVLSSWMVWNKLSISVVAHEFACVHLKIQPDDSTEFYCPLKYSFPVGREFVVAEGNRDIVVVDSDGDGEGVFPEGAT